MRLVGVEREDVARLELHRGLQLGRRDLRQAQVLHVHDLARQGGDDDAADEPVLAQHLSDQLDGGGQAQLGVVPRLLGHLLRRGGAPRAARP